ncbi:MAG: protein translocase subunit SecF [Rhodobacteraceae bacterium]|nr:protein translocase subunit SecF [Paracoccaceae bacterium]
MRIRLVPEQTDWPFLAHSRTVFLGSIAAMVVSLLALVVIGLNYGIDFRGGTSIRTQSMVPVDVGAYRQAVAPLDLGDVSITEVFDPTFAADQHVAVVRIAVQKGDEAIAVQRVREVQDALRVIDPAMTFPLVESVGPKVSGELVKKAIYAVLAAIGVVLFYIWVRFEWQFSLGAVAALVHDVVLTIGVFCILQIKFDLAIIAALLTIVGYSLNDTVVVFDRVRENLRKYKKPALKDVLNRSLNDTLSRTVMTSVTTFLALLALFVFGGDVIRGFVFAMMWGVVVGTYSSIFVASFVLLTLGVKRDWSKPDDKSGTKFMTK